MDKRLAHLSLADRMIRLCLIRFLGFLLNNPRQVAWAKRLIGVPHWRELNKEANPVAELTAPRSETQP